MDLVEMRRGSRTALRWAAILAVALSSTLPTLAQNKKNSWEVFIYFGGFYSEQIPSARQFGEITTYRVAPEFMFPAPFLGNPFGDPNDITQVFTPNAGLVGGDQTNDPNFAFIEDPGAMLFFPPCNANVSKLTDPNDSRAPYFDECDPDIEAIWRYNASGIKTNDEIQKDSSEFMLGLRAGYNITRHWEVELDVGFGKQRIDLTQNLIPMLTQPMSQVAACPSVACDLAAFYQFTWGNRDYDTHVPSIPRDVPGEHPLVISSRSANDPNYNLPMYYPQPRDNSSGIPYPPPEAYADVTGFVNRVFEDPTAFRNRGDQINIDNFTVSGSVLYNFNTKADSRIVPYLQAGFGQRFRNFDSPYDGGDTNFLAYGGGVRFFVNEIFSFRADLRNVSYVDDSFTITAELSQYNLIDKEFSSVCMRDQRNIELPCAFPGLPPAEIAFPSIGNGGGNAFIDVEAELDDYFEVRIGFDVILGGK